MDGESGWAVAVEDPAAEDVRALVRQHLAFSRAQTPPEFAFALDADGLDDDSVTLFGVRARGELLGLAALKELSSGHGEIKSMHTAQAARGRGVARTLLEHLISVAAERGLNTLSVETGTQPAFSPARSLYESAGFTSCGPFADYPASPYSAFMTRALDAG
jgi:putative acetyltransferase